MSSRMDKYKNEQSEEVVPTRSSKNKELYKQIYNAYDEFENLIVPSNAREINPSELKKEITSRQEYRKKKDIEDITNNGSKTNNSVIRKEKILEEQEQANEIYDINELLNKATSSSKGPELIQPSLANDDYLKKLKLDSRKTNIEQVKEMYDDIKEESLEEDEALMKTANLSLEILSDLKGDNGKTVVSAPIKNEELPDDDDSQDFYSNTYKFSKKDFEGKKDEKLKETLDEDEEDDEDDESDEGNGKFFFKILMLIFGLLLVALVLVYFIGYFNKV